MKAVVLPKHDGSPFGLSSLSLKSRAIQILPKQIYKQVAFAAAVLQGPLKG